MTPWELVKKSEHSHQRAVFAWANCAALYGFWYASKPEAYSLVERQKMQAESFVEFEPVPELARLFAVHNQGHGDKIRGAHARAEGVKPGVPDIILPVDTIFGNGLFIELKRLKGGVISDEQNDWAAFLQTQGYEVRFAKGWVEAVNYIAAYMGSTVVVS